MPSLRQKDAAVSSVGHTTANRTTCYDVNAMNNESNDRKLSFDLTVMLEIICGSNTSDPH